MKMLLGNTPVKSLNIHHFEKDTNDATMLPSDLQAGVTAYARGQKVTGTGKAFEFAMYGALYTNESMIIPTTINVIEIASVAYPVQLKIELSKMKNTDFSTVQSIAAVIVDGATYDIVVSVIDGELILSCDKTIKLQVFYGKDNYV